MCFGNEKTTQKTSQTSTPPGWLTSAAQGNLGYVQGLSDKGFQPYTGNQVASFSPQQQSSFDLGSQVAGGVQPYVGQSGQLLSNYANAGAQQVQGDTIANNMSPYMNQYVQQALQPQLQAQDQQFAAQNKSFDSAATGAGAFGDTGWNLGRSNLTNQQDLARTGLIGNAYNSAFNTAIGAGAQDVANKINVGGMNANLAETALGRQLGGANALYSQGTGATNLINTLGGQQTAQQQAGLNAQYNQWLLGQQYPFQVAQLMNSSLAASKAGAPTSTTSETRAPDNAGYGLLGAGVGALPGMIGSNPTFNGAYWSGGGGLLGLMSGPTGIGAADGGKVKGKKPVLVGERGPEVYVPKKDGVIVPNEILQAAREKRAQKLAPRPSMPSLSEQLGIVA